MIFLFPLYVKYTLEKDRSSELSRVSSSKSLSAEDKTSSNISALPPLERKPEKLVSLDVLSNRVLIPHLLNVFVSKTIGVEERWKTVNSFIELWTKLSSMRSQMV